MRTLLRLGAVLAALAISATAACAHPGARADTVPAGFRELTFNQFTNEHFLHDLPVHFVIPAEYVSVSNPVQKDRTYWASKADSAGQAANEEYGMKDGFYSVQLSMSIGYDQDRRMFMGSGMDETSMKAEYTGNGFTNVSLERYDVNGYPVLFVEADKDGRHAMLVYVGALVETNTIVAFYSEAHVPSETDRVRRAALKQGILASGTVHRVY
jgi:hypothetical protein